MSSPWQILGLDPATADEKQVRSAYARLLKQTRPDRDPAGFQALRQAYEFALRWLRTKGDDEEPAQEDWDESPVPDKPEHPSPTSRFVPLPPPPQLANLPPQEPPPRARKPEPRVWPREWSFAVEALMQAVKNARDPDHPFEMPIQSALTALTVDAVEQHIPAEALVIMIEDAFAPHPGLFARTVTDRLLLCLLDKGAVEFVQEVIASWQASASSPRLAQFANMLSHLESGWIDKDNARIVFSVAKHQAFHRPLLARELEQKLAAQLGRDVFALDFMELRMLIERGQMFRHLNADLRCFWEERLTRPAPAEWTSPRALQALRDAVARGPGWEAFETVQAVVPPDVWQAEWRGRWWHRMRAGMSTLFRTVFTFPAFIGCMAMFTLVAAVRSCNETHPRSRPPVPPAPPKDKKEDRSRQELEKSLQEILKRAAQVNLESDAKAR